LHALGDSGGQPLLIWIELNGAGLGSAVRQALVRYPAQLDGLVFGRWWPGLAEPTALGVADVVPNRIAGDTQATRNRADSPGLASDEQPLERACG
jgi:hypothetical protein